MKAGVNVRIVTNKFPGEDETSEGPNLTIYRLPLFKKERNLKYLTLERPGFLFSNSMKRLVEWSDVVYIPRCWYSAIPIVKALKKPVVVHLHSYNLTCPVGSMYNFSKQDICHNCRCNPRCITSHEMATGGDSRRAILSAALNLTIEPFFRQCIQLSDALICVSNAERALVVNRMPTLAKKLKVVYNPLPQLDALKLDGSDMGFFGGNSLLKGFRVLIDSLKITDGILVHATKFNKLSNKILNVGLSKIKFYGQLDKENYKIVYTKLSTVLVPSIWPETWGYVVTEGLLRGRLIISARSGGISEQIHDLKGCFSFENGDVKEMSQLMTYVKGLNREKLTDLGLKNREGFLKRISNEEILKSFIAILDNVPND